MWIRHGKETAGEQIVPGDAGVGSDNPNDANAGGRGGGKGRKETITRKLAVSIARDLPRLTPRS